LTTPADDPQPAAAAGGAFDAARLASLVGTTTAVLRSWLQRDLLRACHRQGRLLTFDFRALTTARTLARLQQAGWNAARIERALRQARQLIADPDAALQGLEASIGRRRLCVRLPDGRLVELGGQQLFDFDAGEGASLHGLRSPAEWFAIGVEAEAAGRIADALSAYQQALPAGSAEVHFNLGNCHYALGDKQQAREQFAATVALAPDYAEAWNNLGNVQGQLGDTAAAVAAYRRALELVPYYADAHYNLADVLAAAGDLVAARQHWRAYLSYDPNSRWAEQVRQRLQQAERGRQE